MEFVLNHLETACFPNSTLYEEEVNLLVSVANRFVEKYPSSARKELRGSFKLIGYHRTAGTDTIMSFDFPGGTDIGHSSSHDIVDAILEQATETKDYALVSIGPKNRSSDLMVIETKYGAFIMAIAMAPRDLGRPFLLQMATAIRELGYAPNSTDKTLIFSIDSLHVSNDDRDEMSRLEAEILGNYFSTPEMKTWFKWHRLHTRAKGDDLGFFFEEHEKKKIERRPPENDRYNGLNHRNQLASIMQA